MGTPAAAAARVLRLAPITMWKISTASTSAVLVLVSLAAATPSAGAPAGHRFEEEALGVQVLLSRAGYSPGEIDGRWGRNTSGALHAFQRTHGLTATGKLDEPTSRALGAGGPVLADYTLTAEDLDGPFVRSIPDDMMERA